jgi:hypothetical protein
MKTHMVWGRKIREGVPCLIRVGGWDRWYPSRYRQTNFTVTRYGGLRFA